jgi:hypothetical protein
MRASLAVALVVSLSPLSAQSSPGDTDESQPFHEPSVVPLLTITSPVGCNLTASEVHALWTYRWQPLEASLPPDSVQFILVDTRNFGSSYSATETYIRTTPDAPEWSKWEPYLPPYTGAAWTSPTYEIGHYVFAVHGKDRDGNVDTEFTKTRNMRRISISARTNGPRLKVTSAYFDPIATNLTTTPLVRIGLPSGTPMEVCWAADALDYCGVVEGFRYGWDVISPDDDSQWGMPFTPFDEAKECLPTNLVQPHGVHILSIEAIDHLGFKSRAQVQVTWHPRPNPPDPWSRSFGDAVDQSAAFVTTGASNNVAVIGNFNGTIALGGGLLVSGGGTDVFVATFNPYGTHLWSRAAGGAGAQTGRGVAMDKTGNVYVIGDFQNSMDFGGGPLVSTGNRDVFLAAYSASGTHRWSKRFGDPGAQYGRGVSTDEDGNVIITGEVVVGAINFGGDGMRTGIFAAKFDADGNHIWSKSFLATGGRGMGVVIDRAGDLLITGGLVGTGNFGDGPETSNGGADIFVTKLDPNGGHVWNQHAGDTELQAGYTLYVDQDGGVVISGTLFGQADLGGGPLVSAGGSDVFIAKFDPEGNHLWSQRFGDALDQYSWGVTARSRGDIFLTGWFAGTTDFGGTPMTSAGGFDAFLVRFDPNGLLIDSQQFGDALNQSGRSVAVDATDDVLFFGDFDGAVTIGGVDLVTAGTRDVFLARLDIGYPVGINDPRSSTSLDMRSYPNPFNPGTTISYELPKAGPVTVAIYDVRGALVRTLVKGTRTAGAHDTRWDGRNEKGEPAPTGVYFARLSFGGHRASHKLVLLK